MRMFTGIKKLRIELNRVILQPSDAMRGRKCFDQISNYQCVKWDSALLISVIITNQFMLYRAKVDVCPEINTKHIYTVWVECTIIEC